ncbi:MAG: DUF1330 domain-containing protein [Caldimonas sp.]
MAAYLIADVEIADLAAYETYRQQVPAIITAYGGRYLVRGGASELLEGERSPKRTVVLEFPTMQALKSFWDSPEYRPLRELRERAATSNIFAVAGL